MREHVTNRDVALAVRLILRPVLRDGIIERQHSPLGEQVDGERDEGLRYRERVEQGIRSASAAPVEHNLAVADNDNPGCGAANSREISHAPKTVAVETNTHGIGFNTVPQPHRNSLSEFTEPSGAHHSLEQLVEVPRHFLSAL